jgi:nucleoside-diphosphate-sugar epimerase
MRVLITGGVGRLGLKACRAFIGDGFQVRLFDLQSKQNVKRVKELGGKAEVLWGDITHPDSVRQALQGVDAIVHLAGLLPPVTDVKPELAFTVNVGGTRVLLDAIRENGRRVPLVFTSSIVVFGATPNATEPLSADKDPVHPEEPYAETKVQAENLIKEAGVDYVILRLGAAFDLDASAIKLMFRLPLTNRIEFCHPDDAIQAIVNAVKYFDRAKGNTLVIAGGPRERMLYRDMLGGALGVLGLPVPPAQKFSQHPYCTDWYDTSKSQELLQFQRRTYADFCRDLSQEFSRRYSPLFIPLMRHFVGPIFGRFIVRLF